MQAEAVVRTVGNDYNFSKSALERYVRGEQIKKEVREMKPLDVIVADVEKPELNQMRTVYFCSLPEFKGKEITEKVSRVIIMSQ